MNWFDYIAQHPHKNLNYNKLSRNPNITWEHVCLNPDKKWDYNCLSENPNITWDIVINNPDCPWNYDVLSGNQMTEHPFFQTKQLRYLLK